MINAVVICILEVVPGVRHARVNGIDSAATVFFDNKTTSVTQLRKAEVQKWLLVKREQKSDYRRMI